MFSKITAFFMVLISGFCSLFHILRGISSSFALLSSNLPALFILMA